MGCTLRVSGKSLDVDEYLKLTSFKNIHVYKKGEPRFKTIPKGKKNKLSGINIVINNGSFDNLKRQIKTVMAFLENNKKEIKRLSNFKGVEGSPVLDFGINIRNYPAQFNRFPAELVACAGKLGLAIELSQYDFKDEINT